MRPCLWQGDGTGKPLDAASPPLAHVAALGFLSDFAFLNSAMATHVATRSIRFSVSLDHTLHVHAPSQIDASKAMLFECDSPWAADGRALVRGRLWGVESGTLLASVVQEGVMRVEKLEGGGGEEEPQRPPPVLSKL